MRARRPSLLGAVLAAALLPAPGAQAADIVFNFVDPPGIGFFDTSARAPVGGNPGTTLGEQRRIVFQTAAAIWEATLLPEVDVVIQATFAPLPCTPTSAVLGAAQTIQVFANFPGAHWPNTWYPSALSNHLANVDLTPGGPDPGLLVPPFNDDIVTFFNGDIGVNPNCLTGQIWYYGLDNLSPANGTDLLNVVLHEFGHGLGFANFMTEANGTALLGLGDVYSAFTRDNGSGLYWNQMEKSERARAAVNTNNEVWRGPNVKAATAGFLIGQPLVRSALGDMLGQAATFGTRLGPPPGVSGPVAVYNDGTGPDLNDACDLFLDANVAGKIAIVNRGTCNFALKAALAQLSGALGVIIVNNQAGLPPMGGGDLIPPTIPSIGVTTADGNTLKANPGTVVSLLADPALGLSGADAAGFPRVYAPNPAQPGSSGSHWDITLTPNALMEPFINVDLKGATTLDLTPDLMKDIGWDGQGHCPVGSDDRETVAVGTCETGVENQRGPFAFSFGLNGRPNGNALGVEMNAGCHIQDLVDACALHGGHGQLESCLAHTTDYLEGIGAIGAADGRALRDCAGQ